MNFNLTNTISPCKDCKTRHSGCHSECSNYLDWKKEYSDQKEKICKEKQKNNLITSYEVSKANKIRKRH